VNVDCQRENGRLETKRGSHPGTCDKTRSLAYDKRPRIEPAPIETDDDRGNGLANPDATEQLQLYRILERHKDANLTISDVIFAFCASCFGVQFGRTNWT